MDKKLLLTVQFVCNAEGVKIPWDKVGIVMGDEISDGAVIQHLAKLRSRMLKAGLDVPPPLRRGGGCGLSGRNSGEGSSQSKPTPVKKVKPNTKKGQKSVAKHDDEEEQDSDNYDASDPEADFQQARSKRTRTTSTTKSTPRRAKVKPDETDDEFDTPTKTGDKRKRKSTTSLAKNEKSKEDRVHSTSKTRTQNFKTDYYDIELNTPEDDEYRSGTEASDQQVTGAQHVASGAKFLRLDSESTTGGQNLDDGRIIKREPGTQSKIVVLSLPRYRMASEQGPDTSGHSSQITPADDEASRCLIPDEESADAMFDEETFEMGSIKYHLQDDMYYDHNNINMMKPFGSAEQIYQVNHTTENNETYFDDAIFHDALEPGFPMSQGDQPLNFKEMVLGHTPPPSGRLVDQDSQIDTKISASAFQPYRLDTGETHSQISGVGLGALAPSFSHSGFSAHETIRNHYPPLKTNFEAPARSQVPELDFEKEFVEWIETVPETSQPLAAIWRGSQPSDSSEALSASTTEFNKTPSFASAGEAGHTPILNFGREYSADFDHHQNLGDPNAFKAYWDSS